MNALLGSLMVLVTFMTLCNAQCTYLSKTKILGDLSDDCQDLQGVTHPLNSKWRTDNCEECSCKQDGIYCCNTFPIPMVYDEIKCQKIFNKETCSFTVVERNNPENSCKVTAWMM
ncbi:beta-microseminoprotein [Saccopteryx leptura]|uniref:beta-microseminoprotein n=1 Tax=Saccopteryx leptura TaxID=249018 RepID=UPI00339C5A68